MVLIVPKVFLGQLAYLELSQFEILTNELKYSPTTADKAHLSEAAAKSFQKYRAIAKSLATEGFDVTDAKNFSVGLSHFLPGGGAEMDATPLEKVYVVVSGEVTVITKSGEVKLGPMDSICLEPGEARAVENRTNLTASMLVVMPYPPK